MAVAAIALGAVSSAKADAAAVVEGYHRALGSALQRSAGAAPAERFAAVAKAMDGVFDFEVMIRTAAAGAWQSADEDTRGALVSAFRRVSIANTAARFADVRAPTFGIDTVRDGPRGLQLVDSTLQPGDGKPVPLTYVLRPAKDPAGEWRIIDVLLNGGISELAIYASEYARLVRTGGADTLIAALKSQATELGAP